VGQNRPQFRAATSEDPGQVKDLVEKLEKYQSPDADDSDYVRLELVKWVLNTMFVHRYFEFRFMYL